MMNLEQLQQQFRDIAQALGTDAIMPTTPRHDGSAHAEQSDDCYFYVVTERGREFNRQQTRHPDELLFWFVRDATWEIAGRWELMNRVPSQDSRRLRFQKHIELLRTVNESWARKQEIYYDDVLTRHPFDDASTDRVDYFVQLQRQGVSSDEAWRRALDQYPELIPRSNSK